MSGFSIAIPTHKHLKQYLSNHISVDPILLNMNNTYCQFLFAMLERPTWENHKLPDHYDAEFKVFIPEYVARWNKFDPSNRTINAFNSFLQKDFQREFRRHMDTAVHFGYSYKIAIEGFMRDFGILDMVEYDTLKKNYYRHRMRTGHPQRKYMLQPA